MGQYHAYGYGSLHVVKSVAEYDAYGCESETHLLIFAPTEDSATTAFNAIAERACDSRLLCIGIVPQALQPTTGSTANPAVVIVTWMIAEGQPRDSFDRIFAIVRDYNAIEGNPVLLTTVKHVATTAELVHQMLHDGPEP
ncbi:hypothetical protein GGI00_002020 [Coemansia sp. RSA 2681]|nr:hypothetical protein GGI00_002020 [Coemansia sp. RSA 2681]